MLEYHFHYSRNLPHYQPAEATLFVTFRLAGSIPEEVLRRLSEEHDRAMEALFRGPASSERDQHVSQEQRRAFGRWEAALDSSDCGPHWLNDPRVATLVVDSLHYWHDRRYTLIAFCVMPNHVHFVFTPLRKDGGEFYSLSQIMHSIKLHTAHEGNMILGRIGDFWQHENYDHVVRDSEECRRIIAYVLRNPVKAGLVQEWQGWPWNYYNAEAQL